MRAALAALAALVVLGVPSGAPAQPESLRSRCAPLDWGFSAAEAQPRGSEVVLPIVLHLMVADVPSHNPRWPNHPLDVWDAATVREFFGRGATAGRVNGQVWRAAGLRVAVVRVEQCTWSPQSLRPDGQAKISAPIPGEGPLGEEFYRRVNDLYNAYDPVTQRALDVYLWVKVGSEQFSALSAHATSLRRPPAAVWADLFCALRDDPSTPLRDQKMEPETCARKLAHEIGHALALPHTCRRADLPASHPEAALPACSQQARGDRDNLMRGQGQSDRLAPAQVMCALDWVRRHYGPPYVGPSARPEGCLR